MSSKLQGLKNRLFDLFKRNNSSKILQFNDTKVKRLESIIAEVIDQSVGTPKIIWETARRCQSYSTVKEKQQTWMTLQLSQKSLSESLRKNLLDGRVNVKQPHELQLILNCIKDLQSQIEIQGDLISNFKNFVEDEINQSKKKAKLLEQRQLEIKRIQRQFQENERIRKAKEQQDAAKQRQKEAAELKKEENFSQRDSVVPFTNFYVPPDIDISMLPKDERKLKRSEQMLQNLKISEQNFKYPEYSAPKSLQEQDYKCKGCGQAISQGLYLVCSNANLCNFDNCYYCNNCFSFERIPIYYKVINDFDTRGYFVSKSSKRLAEELKSRVVIEIEYSHRIVTENERMFRFLVLKRELHLMYDLFCQPQLIQNIIGQERINYLVKPNILSLKNMIDIHNGSEEKRMVQRIDILRKHFDRCRNCQAKGTSCAICKSQIRIFVFDLEKTMMCRGDCKRLYHRLCLATQNCPKCLHR